MKGFMLSSWDERKRTANLVPGYLDRDIVLGMGRMDIWALLVQRQIRSDRSGLEVLLGAVESLDW